MDIRDLIDVEKIDRDMPNRRVVEVEDTKYIVEREDPYGLCRIHLERGQLPAALKTARFTSYDEAYKAIAVYVNSKKKTKEPTT